MYRYNHGTYSAGRLDDGTRCGDIDGGAITYIMKKEGLTPDEMSTLLNKKSGVLGMFEKSSDMRELEDAVARGEERAILTENMYFYRITKYIGAYAAAMGGVDVILFTGGVGENQATARAGVCKTLGFLGVEIDPERNKVRSKEAIISTDSSKVKVVVIPTDQEADDCYRYHEHPEQQIITGILKELKRGYLLQRNSLSLRQKQRQREIPSGNILFLFAHVSN